MPRSRRRLIRKRPSGRSWWPVFVAVAVGASLGVVLVARSQQWGLDGGVAAHADRHGHTAKTTYTQPPTLHPPALRGPGRPAQPQLVERSGDGSGPSPAVLAAVSEAADNKFVPGSFARHWGWKDCKSWSFGIGIARSPLEPPLWSLEVVSPFVLWDEFDFAAPVADSLAQLLTADPFLVPGDDEANWFVLFEMSSVPHPGIAWGKIQVPPDLIRSPTTPPAGSNSVRFSYGGFVDGLENGHASYPYTVKHGGRYYMLPLITGATLTIYEAVDFPRLWNPAVIVCDPKPTREGRWLDSSLVHWEGRWYVFAGYYDDTVDSMPRNYIFVCATECATPLGEWRWHPSRSHVPGDLAWQREHGQAGFREFFGRGAGRIIPWGHVLVRPTQWYRRNSHPYGPVTRAAVVTRLTARSFREVYHPEWILSMSKAELRGGDRIEKLTKWDSFGAHHVDYQPLSNGLWLVARDGREACAFTESRINFRCSLPTQLSSQECRAFWGNPHAFKSKAIEWRTTQTAAWKERLDDEDLEGLLQGVVPDDDDGRGEEDMDALMEW